MFEVKSLLEPCKQLSVGVSIQKMHYVCVRVLTNLCLFLAGNSRPLWARRNNFSADLLWHHTWAHCGTSGRSLRREPQPVAPVRCCPLPEEPVVIVMSVFTLLGMFPQRHTTYTVHVGLRAPLFICCKHCQLATRLSPPPPTWTYLLIVKISILLHAFYSLFFCLLHMSRT